MEIFLDATHSSHEGSHHVGSVDVQLSRDTEITRMSPRDTGFKLPFSRYMVYLQDHMANQGVNKTV